MIAGFRHKGLEALYLTGSAKGIQPAHKKKLQRILLALSAAAGPEDLSQPGFGLHPLKGNMAGHWSIWVNGNWRVVFRFVGQDVELVDYLDYH